MWWKPHRSSYTYYVSEAGRYSEAESREILANANKNCKIEEVRVPEISIAEDIKHCMACGGAHSEGDRCPPEAFNVVKCRKCKSENLMPMDSCFALKDMHCGQCDSVGEWDVRTAKHVDLDMHFDKAKQLTPEQHAQAHAEMHRVFAKLVSEYIEETHKVPTHTKLVDFIHWSHEQTKAPISSLVIHKKCGLPVELCECPDAPVKYDSDNDTFIEKDKKDDETPEVP